MVCGRGLESRRVSIGVDADGVDASFQGAQLIAHATKEREKVERPPGLPEDDAVENATRAMHGDPARAVRREGVMGW